MGSDPSRPRRSNGRWMGDEEIRRLRNWQLLAIVAVATLGYFVLL